MIVFHMQGWGTVLQGQDSMPLFMNISATTHGRIITNNRLSLRFNICSGIRQGDPIAPLFIITLELAELTYRGSGVQAHCNASGS